MHKESEFNNGKFWHQLFGKRFQPSAFKIKMFCFFWHWKINVSWFDYKISNYLNVIELLFLKNKIFLKLSLLWSDI